MHLILLLWAVLLLVPHGAWAKPQCEQDYAIWVSEADGIRHIVYGSEGVRYYSKLYFEEWRQSKLAWRSKGMVTCSTGAVICYAQVENASGLDGDDATLDQYIDELRINADEVTALVGDLMISGTGFFRDAEARNVLAKLVIAPMVAERETGASIRVWTTACSTGEEAYSLAMLMTEHAEAAGKHFDLKVFATDAQGTNLRKARDGIYPAAALAGVSVPRLTCFFEKLDGSFKVSKEAEKGNRNRDFVQEVANALTEPVIG